MNNIKREENAEVKAYKQFMFNPENSFNCKECPANNGFRTGWGGVVGPCGQQHCWVNIYCSRDQSFGSFLFQINLEQPYIGY